MAVFCPLTCCLFADIFLIHMGGNRITIMGASGTGKTTLATALAQRLTLQVFDTDFYYHYQTDPPFQKQRTSEERNSFLVQDLAKHESWIVSGNVPCWEPTPNLDYTLVVFLYLTPQLRMERLKTRETKLYGARISAGGDMEQIHREFMDWTSGYDSGEMEGTLSLRHHEAFLKEAPCPVLRFDGGTPTAKQIDSILSHIRGQ
jgi:adenylate kinase family enzyme